MYILISFLDLIKNFKIYTFLLICTICNTMCRYRQEQVQLVTTYVATNSNMYNL
jgi:hypothetical protein